MAIFRQVFIYAFVFSILIWVTQITRFSNQWEIDLGFDRISLKSHLSEVSVPIQSTRLVKITAKLQRSVLHQSGIIQFKVLQNDNQITAEKKRVFYLWGRDWLDQMIKPNCPEFRASFGDWTMDNELCSELTLFEGALEGPLQIDLGLLGRGTKIITLHFENGAQIAVDNSDGFIDNSFHICANGECTGDYSRESRLTNLSRLTNFFAECLLGALIILMLWKSSAFIASKLRAPQAQQIILPNISSRWILALIVSLHFALALAFGNLVLDSTPHIPDSAIYYKQALLLSKGMLSIPNFELQPFEAISPSGSILRDGTLYFHYNHFWAALLALPMLLGLQALFLPLISALTIVLLYLLACKLYDSRTATIAALIYALSPLSIIMAGDFMTHTATQLLLMGVMYCVLKYLWSDSKIAIFCAGLLLGFAFGIRQLTSIGVFAPIGIFLLSERWRSPQFWKAVVLLGSGFGMFLIVCLLDNKVVTGNAFVFPHTAYHGLSVSWNNLAEGLNIGDAVLGYLAPILFYNPWPQLFLSFCFLGLIAGGTKKEDFMLFGIFLCLFCAYLFSNANGLHGYGPRFVFEATFALTILVSRALVRLWQQAGEIGRCVLGLFCMASFAFNAYGLATILPRYENYNGIDTRVIDKLKTIDLRKAVIITKNPYWNGLDTGTIFFDPEFEEGVFVRELQDGSHSKILSNYRGRILYEMDGAQLINRGPIKD